MWNRTVTISSIVDQDRSRWDQDLVVEGLNLLEHSAERSHLTAYHVDAVIASVHARLLVRQHGLENHLFAPQRGLEEFGLAIHGVRPAAYPLHPAALVSLNSA